MSGTRLGLATAVLIAGLGVCGLLVLNRLAEDAHEAEPVVVRLELVTARLHSWDTRTASGQSGAEQLPTAQSRAEEMTQLADELRHLAGSEPAAMRLVVALDDYRAVLDLEGLQLAAGDDLTAIDAVHTDQVIPRYNAVAAALNPAQTAIGTRAERVSWLVSAGSVITLIGALVATGLLVWGIERARRASERRGEARFRGLVQNATDLIAILDPDARLRYASPAAQTLLGRSPETLVGTSLLTCVDAEDALLVRRALELTLDRPHTNVTQVFRLRHQDGSLRHVEATWRNLRDEQEIAGIVLNVRDVSERKALEDELAHRAFHDALTELPNRALLTDRLRQALADGGRRGGAAVVFIDLDDFKVINDSLGHDVGDQVLAGVAARLRASVRPGDMVARLGGDEFIVLLEDVDEGVEAVDVAERCRAQLRVPFVLDGREVVVGASIGVATSGPGAALPNELLRRGDLAMYAAKARGKGQLSIFEPGFDLGLRERVALEADLRRAVERDELRLNYQPIVDVETRRISGVEALLRWQHPQRGLVPPDQFIPLAETTGLIVHIGRWVLDEACRQAAAWDRADVVLSVNISGRQFQHPGLVDDVAGALRRAGLAPARLKLEITESVAMGAGAATVQTMQALKRLGVQLAIDDFGTGYSSLSYLKSFPIDTLKIDRSFVDGLGRSAQDTAIVRSIVTIARSLDLSVTAEGIETVDQLEELRALACNEAQGYYFARPQPAPGLRELLDRERLGPDNEQLAA